MFLKSVISTAPATAALIKYLKILKTDFCHAYFHAPTPLAKDLGHLGRLFEEIGPKVKFLKGRVVVLCGKFISLGIFFVFIFFVSVASSFNFWQIFFSYNLS